jgi:hypothetical protein
MDADLKVRRQRKRIMSEVLKQSELNDEALSWLAFRYVSDEMSDAEVSEFESRLDPDSQMFDLAACESVARAVQLNDAIVVACEPVTRPATPSTLEEPNRRDVSARRVSLLAASITVLIVGWALTLPSVPRSVKMVEHPAPQLLENSSDFPGELVYLWADSDSELLSEVEVPALPAEDLPEYFSTDVPEWLLAAVQTRDASSTSPEVMEN